MNVVVVEDNEPICQLVQTIIGIEEPDWQVLCADPYTTDVFNPLFWADADVALIDWSMPHITGGEVMDFLAENYPGVRLVLFTALDPEDLPLDRHPHVAVLRKPASVPSILGVLRQDGR